METGQNRLKIFVQRYFATTIILLTGLLSFGQVKNTEPSSSKKATTYLLDGKVFNLKKLDSLKLAWGKDEVLFAHDEEDDKNNIMRLVRLTDEMKQEMLNKKNSLSEMENQAAPDFKLNDINGKQWHLNELRGKIVVLNFWFTSCAPCIKEIPDLNKLTEDFKNQDVVFLGLSFNSQAQVESFLKKRKFEYTILADSKEVNAQYKVSSFPTSMVIDKNGTIKFVTSSSTKIREDLKAVIDSLLKS